MTMAIRALLFLALLCAAPSINASTDRGSKGGCMPFTGWVDLLAQDGSLSETVSVPVSGGGVVQSNAAIGASVPTDAQVTGIEIQLVAVASHPGVRVSFATLLSTWDQLNAPFDQVQYFTGESLSARSPFLPVGVVGDLATAEPIGLGGTNAFIEDAETYIYGAFPGNPNSILDPLFWSSTVSTAPGGNPFYRTTDLSEIGFESTQGYDATVWIDGFRLRVFYNTGDYAALSASGTVSATMVRARPISCAMSASGTMAAVGNANRVLSAAMAASARIAPAISRSSGGVVSTYLMPEFSASGTMAVTPLIRRGTVAANLVGRSSMAGVAVHGKNIAAPSRNGTLSLSGTGVLTQRLAAKRPITRSLTGSGAITMALLAQRPLPAGIAGAGTLSLAALAAVRPLAAAVGAAGTMTVLLQNQRPFVAQNMTGAASMEATLLAQRPIPAALAAAGIMTIPESAITANTRLIAGEHCTFIVPSREIALAAPVRSNTFEVGEC